MMSRRLTVIFASLLLCLAQLGLVVHAAEHPFHDKTAACDSFVAAEKHNSATSDFQSIDIDIVDHELYQESVDDVTPRSIARYFQARAPPSIAS